MCFSALKFSSCPTHIVLSKVIFKVVSKKRRLLVSLRKGLVDNSWNTICWGLRTSGVGKGAGVRYSLLLLPHGDVSWYLIFRVTRPGPVKANKCPCYTFPLGKFPQINCASKKTWTNVHSNITSRSRENITYNEIITPYLADKRDEPHFHTSMWI